MVARMLPVDDVLDELTRAVRVGNVVLHAPTGAGKTTRVPPALLGAMTDGLILVVEPRRVAARAAAARMAEERGEPLGETIGYQVRLERVAGPQTRVLVVTEGILLRRVVADPLLDGVAAIVLDEVHERSVDGDLVLAMVRHLQRELRPELRIVAMSATAQIEPMAAFLQAKVVRCEGRAYPVSVTYRTLSDDRELTVRVSEAVREVVVGSEGDVLVFLPGAGEIDDVGRALHGLGVEVVPLHGSLPPAAQDRALRPGAGRRVVLATNVAETSVTLPSVRTVVDAGLVRRVRHDPRRGLDRLQIEPHSQASADQRAGRAGRVAAGTCLRLWTPREHTARAEHDVAEVHRVDLSGPLLSILAWGEPRPADFPWYEAPPESALRAATELLTLLGAVDDRGLTSVGRAMASLPASPRLARLVVEGHRRGVLADAASVAALLSDRLPFRRERGSTHRSGDDLEDLLDALRGVRGHGWTVQVPSALESVRRTAEQLTTATRRCLGPEPRERVEHGLRQALLAAWPDRVGRLRSLDRYTLASGRGARLAPDSAVRGAAWLVALDVVDGDDVDARIHLASAIEPEWLHAEDRVEAAWDAARNRVVGRRVAHWGALVLREQEGVEVSADAVADALCRAAAGDLARALPTEDPAWTSLVGRLRFLATQRPELGLPTPDPATLIPLLPELAVGCRRLSELREADWRGALLAQLDRPQRRALDELAPEHIQVPSGSSLRVGYPDDGPPFLAVRMQELFGCAQTPTVGGMPVRLHLLAPNGRPQQVTDDLAGFWKRLWPEIRSELRGRYPKHDWPEDPLRAQPRARPGRPRTPTDTVGDRKKS